jgi:hypothetical protein
VPEIRLPAPLSHQVPVLAHAARFKLWRAGRRTGKSRGEFVAAVAGHGPGRVRRGVMQGGKVAWFAPDYKQAQAIWREEIKPRFAGVPGVDVSEVEKRVSIAGLGSLQLLSAENIDAARGWKLDGAVLDEAAYFDMEYALNAVIRPALADREGWLFAGSTTNAGHDGNSAKRVPSYFNLLCERVERGELGADWAAFHNRTEDNAKIPRAEIAALRAEYPEGSAVAAQELDAELGVAGGRYYQVEPHHRVPFADFARAINATADGLVVPDWWEAWGAFDWGYAHWAVAGAFAKAGAATYLLGTHWTRRQQDDDLAAGMGRLVADCGLPRHLPIYAGHDCWAKVTARGGTGITTADVFADAGLWLQRADIDRANGGRALRRVMAQSDDTRTAGFYVVVADGTEPAVLRPYLAGNARVLTQLADAIPDANDVNKPMKVDADADGKGGDDGADMVRYGIATRVQATAAPVPVPDYAGERRDDPRLLAEILTSITSTSATGDDERAWDDLPAGY